MGWLCDANADANISAANCHTDSTDCYADPDCYVNSNCHTDSANRRPDVHAHSVADRDADAHPSADADVIPTILDGFVFVLPGVPGDGGVRYTGN